MNQYGIDYACPGFCSKCHTEIANFKGSVEVSPGVYRLKVVSMKSNARANDVILSDGTTMTISVCEDCMNVMPDDLPQIMDSERRGWEKEREHFKLGNDVKEWVESSKGLSIIDVPSLSWDEQTKTNILTSIQSKGVNSGISN